MQHMLGISDNKSYNNYWKNLTPYFNYYLSYILFNKFTIQLSTCI
jgi:hypothetical protein